MCRHKKTKSPLKHTYTCEQCHRSPTRTPFAYIQFSLTPSLCLYTLMYNYAVHCVYFLLCIVVVAFLSRAVFLSLSLCCALCCVCSDGIVVAAAFERLRRAFAFCLCAVICEHWGIFVSLEFCLLSIKPQLLLMKSIFLKLMTVSDASMIYIHRYHKSRLLRYNRNAIIGHTHRRAC